MLPTQPDLTSQSNLAISSDYPPQVPSCCLWLSLLHLEIHGDNFPPNLYSKSQMQYVFSIDAKKPQRSRLEMQTELCRLPKCK